MILFATPHDQILPEDAAYHIAAQQKGKASEHLFPGKTG